MPDNYKITILCMDGAEETLDSRADLLRLNGFEVIALSDPTNAMEIIKTKKIDVIVTDIRFEGYDFDIESFLIECINLNIGIVVLSAAIWKDFSDDLPGIILIEKPARSKEISKAIKDSYEKTKNRDKKIKILLVDNDIHFRQSLAGLLKGEGFEVFDSGGVFLADGILNKQQIDVIITDISLGYESQETVEKLITKALEKGIEVIVHTGASWYEPPTKIKGIEILLKGNIYELFPLVAKFIHEKREYEKADPALIHKLANPDWHIKTPSDKILDKLSTSKDEKDKLTAYREFLDREIRKAHRQGHLSKKELDQLIIKRNQITAKLK